MSTDPSPRRRPHAAPMRDAIVRYVGAHPGVFPVELGRALVAEGAARSVASVVVLVNKARAQGYVCGVPLYVGSTARRFYVPGATPPLAPDGTCAPCEWCSKPATGHDEAGDPECDHCRTLRAAP